MLKLQTRDVSYFIGKIFFVYGGSQNMFVYQLILNTLELKNNNDTNYVLC